jgi:hypothetical protein
MGVASLSLLLMGAGRYSLGAALARVRARPDETV